MEQLYEHHFFTNRKAGHGKSEELTRLMEQIYTEQGLKPIIHETKSIDQAKYEIGRLGLTKSPKYIYSIGGDGTLNAVVNGMVGHKNLVLRVIPGGTGNDFYKMLGVDFPEQPIDLIKINDSYTVGITSFGFDAEVTRYVEEVIKDLNKSNPFMAGIVREILVNPTLKTNDINYVDTTGEKFHIVNDLTLMAICNGAYYGSGIHIAPSAKINDGQLDLIFAYKMCKLKLLFLLMKVKASTHEGDRSVFSKKITSLELHSDVPIICNNDGMISRGTDFDIGIKPGIIKVNNDFIEQVKILLKQYK